MALPFYHWKNFYHYNVFDKKQITILVTDSGIGGLSVANDLYRFFLNNSYYKEVNIVYADSRINNIGYNSLETTKEKIDLFSKKLFQLDKKIKPDIIFIACNTLSVILNQTDFYKKNKKPIIDILNCSLNLMQKALNENYGLFILGTKTTIGENFYKKQLIEMGYDEENIVNQLCPNLAKYVEELHVNRFYMEKNVDWLTNRIIEKKPCYFNKIAISFNCTHYYYTVKAFKKAFNKLNIQPQFLCPNRSLKNSFTDYLNVNNFCFCNVNFYIYNPKITKSKKNKIEFFLKNKNLYFFS